MSAHRNKIALATVLMSVAACVSGTVAMASNRHVMIMNDTGYTMVSFQASNRDEPTWQEDILGRRVLRPGGMVNVNIDDGTGYCKYDFKATFADGDTVIRRNYNVCTGAYWRVFD